MLPVSSIVKKIIPVIGDVLTMCQSMPVLYEDWINLLAKLIPVLTALKGKLVITSPPPIFPLSGGSSSISPFRGIL